MNDSIEDTVLYKAANRLGARQRAIGQSGDGSITRDQIAMVNSGFAVDPQHLSNLSLNTAIRILGAVAGDPINADLDMEEIAVLTARSSFMYGFSLGLQAAEVAREELLDARG